MKESDFIERFAKKGYTKRDAKCIMDDFAATIMEALVDGDEVHLHGFGTFSVINVKPHDVNMVRTGEKMSIPSYRCPKFAPGMTLKRAVREGVIRQ